MGKLIIGILLFFCLCFLADIASKMPRDMSPVAQRNAGAVR